MTFGEKLQMLRKAREWSQEELAGRINVSRQTLSRWEQDAVVPDTENVVALSRLFGVTTDYLLLAAPAPAGAQEPSVQEENTPLWPRGRKILLAAAIMGAVGLVATQLLTGTVMDSMIDGVSGNAVWEWEVLESGGSAVSGVFGAAIWKAVLLSLLNRLSLILLAAGGVGAAFYHPLLRLWRKHCRK